MASSTGRSELPSSESEYIARGEETFDNDCGERLLKAWGVPPNYIARCFVILGYIDGEPPHTKPVDPNRSKIVE